MLVRFPAENAYGTAVSFSRGVISLSVGVQLPKVQLPRTPYRHGDVQVLSPVDVAGNGLCVPRLTVR